VNAASGALIWHYAPSNIATFLNYGIVANRGVTYCDGTLFLLTLDMTIVALDPATGAQLARVPISRAVPGAQSNYGYSETSAGECADGRLIVGAAGSEYGARGFVMAYEVPSLAPAWANPFWTVPPNDTEWRRDARIVGGGVIWTTPTVDLTTGMLYIGTGAATPPYYPSLRPGSDPRADSLIAIDLATGRMDWWQQLLPYNEWSYDASQPPLVYTARIGGRRVRVVSIATMEGVWFAFNAVTGAPIWQRVKVLDNVEHPNLQPGVPVVVYPSSLGGLNYSPASYDPETEYVYNAASETASVLVQQTSVEEERQALLAGDVFLGLANGDYGQYLASGWHDYGSISAIDVATGKVVWKIDTPQPERGGPTTTASGLGFDGGGDGVLRAFNARTGQVLWSFQTGYQIADGPTVYAVNGVEFVAIGVGGTATSSNGGTQASQIQVFALGGSSAQAAPPTITTNAPRAVYAPRAAHAPAAAAAAAAAGGAGRVSGPAGLVVSAWDANSSNTEPVAGRVTLGGQPVVGAVVRVDGWVDPSPTDAAGAFSYPLDDTTPARHVATVVADNDATVAGRRLSAAQRAALLGASGGISVGYQISGLSARVDGAGDVVVSGRLSVGSQAPPTVLLYSYLLRGVVTGPGGAPVAGAVITTRTNDRQYWTQSRPSGADGAYASFLVAADQEGDNPVPMEVGVAVGGTAYSLPAADEVNFAKLQSDVLNIQLPAAAGATLTPAAISPQPIPGGIYQGLLVGVVGGNGGVIRPLSASWPDSSGRFRLVLPAAARGLTVKFWQDNRQFFSATAAAAGGPVNLADYPSTLPADAPQDLATLSLPH